MADLNPARDAVAADMPPNEEQRAFIDFMEGAALLHAPVGTGKTRSLADRAAAAIQRGVPADRILCLTFTNRAAQELRDRVTARCGQAGRHIMVRTFHSLCAWLLRQEYERVGLPPDFVIYDEQDAEDLLRYLMSTRFRDRPGAITHPGELYRNIQRAKADLAAQCPLRLGELRERVAGTFPAPLHDLILEYENELLAQRAVDFDNLVLFVRALFDEWPDVRERWRRRFVMLQVDEMQDTNLAEYLVLRELARGSGNIVLAGDFDQTIYEWRGSRPDEILRRFEKDFGPVRRFHFVQNYRSTRVLIEVAASVVSAYSQREPARADVRAPQGEPVGVHFADDSEEEARWIAQRIQRLRAQWAAAGEELPYHRIGVLVRANYRAQDISRTFEALGVPHITVEEYEFFRRQEVKDALAHLRFALNPADSFSFRRTLQRPAHGIGQRTLAAIEAAQPHGLRLVDMVAPATLRWGEPFGHVLEAFDRGSITIFDAETTGTVPGKDEIVELAAVRLENGVPARRFHKFLRNTVPVGASEQVHGWSDDFLRRHGEDPAQVLAEFARFAAGSLLVGHNVNFDVAMLVGQAERLGVEMPVWEWADTWEMARRFVQAESYALEELVETLALTPRQAHKAYEDVEATRDLLTYLIPLVRNGAEARREVVSRFRAQFEAVARRVQTLRERVGVDRPYEVLKYALETSGLAAFYAREPRRKANLERLLDVFRRKDDPELTPRAALEMLVQSAALTSNVDLLEPEEGGVRLLTVHQSKGLEFDVVFVPGLCEREFPSARALASGRLDEEVRVFYVAVTRAKRRLFLTGHRYVIYPSGGCSPREPSRFLKLIGRHWRWED